jgi:hypothetical protein
MSDEERKPMGIPPFYWAKGPAKSRPPSTGFVNSQQRKFAFVVTSFKLAKIVAAAVLALLIIGRI